MITLLGAEGSGRSGQRFVCRFFIDWLSSQFHAWHVITAFPAGHQGGNDKCATGAKLRGRQDITIATWNVRTLSVAGEVEELLHEIDRYKWNILGLCEMRWKTSGEIPTNGGQT